MKQHLRAALEECHGRHIPAPLDEAEKLHWQPVYGQLRVIAHTCHRCDPISYEFGLLGGAYIIRRTDRTKLAHTVVTQTPTVRHRLAREWWDALLYGWAA